MNSSNHVIQLVECVLFMLSKLLCHNNRLISQCCHFCHARRCLSICLSVCHMLVLQTSSNFFTVL